MNTGTVPPLNTQDRLALLREVALIFKRAAPADRCWLADRIAEGRERIHARSSPDGGDEVDRAIDIMEGRE